MVWFLFFYIIVEKILSQDQCYCSKGKQGNDNYKLLQDIGLEQEDNMQRCGVVVNTNVQVHLAKPARDVFVICIGKNL